jgi:hypothetical protein
MSSARLFRPLARALQRPVARPSFAAFSTKSVTKPLLLSTPSINAQLRAKTQVAPAAPKTQLDETPMTKLVGATVLYVTEQVLTRFAEGYGSRHAPAHPILLRQRDGLCLCPPANPHLPFLQVPPPTARPRHVR